jgi:hypothetical protein
MGRSAGTARQDAENGDGARVSVGRERGPRTKRQKLRDHCRHNTNGLVELAQPMAIKFRQQGSPAREPRAVPTLVRATPTETINS